MSDAESYPDQRKVVQYVDYGDGLDGDGHGTHVSGIAAGGIYEDWKAHWEEEVIYNKRKNAVVRTYLVYYIKKKMINGKNGDSTCIIVWIVLPPVLCLVGFFFFIARGVQRPFTCW